jgi:hypothetical protein
VRQQPIPRVFSDGYDQLPTEPRFLGLRCRVTHAPGPYHRIVDSGQFQRVVTIIADLALFPFALALGLDVFVTAGRVFGEVGAVIAGVATAAVTVALWYGFPRLRRL